MDIRSEVILVTGATGRQGGAVARHLIQSGWRVRALTRDPDKPSAEALRELGCEVVAGDLDDRSSLERAIHPSPYGVYSVQDFWEHGYEPEVRQGRNLADAAHAANVHHFVYSSVGGAERNTGIPHFDSKYEIEQYIHTLGLPATIVRPVWFMENWLAPAFLESIQQGTLAMAIEANKLFQMISVDDIGALVALAFGDPDRWIGREVEIAGDEKTPLQIAQAFSGAMGRQVTYQQIPMEEVRAASEENAHMFEWFNREGYRADIRALRRIHPTLKTLDDWLHQTGLGASHSASQSR